MKKILVIGSSGSGKSTFARRLGEILDLPVIHLDSLFWSSGWIETPKDEWRTKVAEALQGDSWIIDGNYSATMDLRLPVCDTVIFLETPRIICVYRILKRVVTYKKGSRPDIPKGCDEKFDWDFVKIVWSYPTRSKPKVEGLLKQLADEKTIIRLKSKKEIERFLSELRNKEAFAVGKEFVVTEDASR
jgi:adenylate kinase family enzyme